MAKFDDEQIEQLRSLLDEGLDGRFAPVHEKLQDMGEKIYDMDTKLSDADEKLRSVDTKLVTVDEELKIVDTKLESVDVRLRAVDIKLVTMDAKLDELIDREKEDTDALAEVQTTSTQSISRRVTNHEKRLKLLEKKLAV